MNNKVIKTPCLNICKYNKQNFCVGCKRNSDEITNWMSYVKINPQMQKLRGGVDILAATPGRLLDLYSQNAVKFDQLEILVFDEAVRMSDMGFIHDIKRILKILPKNRQTLMLSATFSDEIRKLAKTLVNNNTIKFF
jgi:superfamily II DNA/RNA helicase